MTLKNLPTAVLGLAAIALLGGCCSSGPCGSAVEPISPVATTSSCGCGSVVAEPVIATDCGCGCSGVSDGAVSYDSVMSDEGIVYDSADSMSSPFVIEDSGISAPFSSSSPTTVVEPPSSSNPGFSAGSTAKSAIENALPAAAGSASKNSLPGNLLPGN